MSTSTFPIVGARFRPPAEILINSLSVGTPLTLMAEPDNAYDPNAIAVWLYSKDIPETAKLFLETNLPNAGKTLEEIVDGEAWHLGYLPKEMAAQLRAANIVNETEPVSVTFSCSPTGAPRVRFEEAVPI